MAAMAEAGTQMTRAFASWENMQRDILESMGKVFQKALEGQLAKLFGALEPRVKRRRIHDALARPEGRRLVLEYQRSAPGGSRSEKLGLIRLYLLRILGEQTGESVTISWKNGGFYDGS